MNSLKRPTSENPTTVAQTAKITSGTVIAGGDSWA